MSRGAAKFGGAFARPAGGIDHEYFHGDDADIIERVGDRAADALGRLAGDRQFCKFTSKKDGSRIHVLLSTLYTDKPTLAALAYYAKVPYSGSCNGNPASCYCSQLGGTDLFGGINLNGGGWVQKSDPVDTVLEACIFPDMSSIDSWGLTYHQAGIIRGKNLDKILRYKNPYGTN